jgi:hypothetical protein
MRLKCDRHAFLSETISILWIRNAGIYGESCEAVAPEYRYGISGLDSLALMGNDTTHLSRPCQMSLTKCTESIL